MDEYLISYPQKNVRESTEKLLGSLFKKGKDDVIEGMKFKR